MEQLNSKETLLPLTLYCCNPTYIVIQLIKLLVALMFNEGIWFSARDGIRSWWHPHVMAMASARDGIRTWWHPHVMASARDGIRTWWRWHPHVMASARDGIRTWWPPHAMASARDGISTLLFGPVVIPSLQINKK